jgi:hypothetical protein
MAPGHRGPLYTRGRSWFLRGGAASLSSLSPFRFGLAPFPASVNLISGACFYAVRPIGKQLTSDDSCGGTANCSWCCRKRKRQHQSKAKRRSAYSRSTDYRSTDCRSSGSRHSNDQRYLRNVHGNDRRYLRTVRGNDRRYLRTVRLRRDRRASPCRHRPELYGRLCRHRPELHGRLCLRRPDEPGLRDCYYPLRRP